MAATTQLDLGVGDVHRPGVASNDPPKKPTAAERKAKRLAEKKARADARRAAGDDLRKRSIHIRADIAPGGSIHVRHMADGSTRVFLPPIPLNFEDDTEQ